MRSKSREETIALYKDKLFEGKSNEFIEKFNNKNINTQYAAVMNWKRSRNKLNAVNNNEPVYSFSNFYRLLKDANKEIENLSSLSPKEAEKAIEIIDSIKSNITNFEKIKKQRLLEDLMKQEEQIQKEGNSLRKKIADLQKELQ